MQHSKQFLMKLKTPLLYKASTTKCGKDQALCIQVFKRYYTSFISPNLRKKTCLPIKNDLFILNIVSTF